MTAQPTGVRLSVALDDPEAVPYFLWDELRLLGKILREARDTDVWRFTTPAEVARLFPELRRHLGRRRTFWEFLLGRWRELAGDGRA